jgi:putative oxidoreductase
LHAKNSQAKSSQAKSSQAKSWNPLSSFYQTLSPFADALLRVAVGLALVPHGLRNTFGFFPNTGLRALNLSALARQLDDIGYRPGKLWAPMISFTQLIGGPLLALGLFTRPVAGVVLVFLLVTNVERWRVGGYFWNQLGMEYTLMWTIATFCIFIHGPGPYSLDRILGI